MTGGAPTVTARLLSGTALQVAGRVFGAACTFALLALLARELPPAEFGRYTFYIGVFAVLDALADFGTGQAAVRLTAGDRRSLGPVLARARRMRLVAAALGLGVLAVLTRVWGEEGRGWILLAGLYPLTHALELSATVFKNEIAWKVPVAVRALASAARLALVAGLALGGVRSAAELVCATALASGAANLVLHLAARRHLPAQQGAPSLPVPGARGVLATAFPLGLGGLCALLYFHVDNLFVRALLGEEELGRYNAGVRLLSVLISVAQMATATALPTLVRRHAQGGTGRAVADLGQPLLAAGALGAGLLAPFAGRILGLAFGPEFVSAGPAFAWLLGAVAVIHAGAVLTTALVAIGAERAFLLAAAAGLALNLAGNALLVPRFGIAGAAAATLATELCVALLALRALVRAGASPLSVRPWAWLAAPALFAAGAALSAAGSALLS